MSEEGNRRNFFSRMFSGEEETSIYSPEDFGMEEPEEEPAELQGFTVERAAEIIEDLPPDVPRASAVRIVRHTLAAAGIEIEDLGRSANRREARLNSEIDLRQRRMQELEDKTEDAVASFEEEIRKAREARDFGVSEEEEGISRARSGLDDVALVRDFFDLPGGEPDADEPPDASSEDETQVLEPDDTGEIRSPRRQGPLADEWYTDEDREP